MTKRKQTKKVGAPVSEAAAPTFSRLQPTITLAQLRDPNYDIRPAWVAANPGASFDEVVHLAHQSCVRAVVILNDSTILVAKQLAS